LIFFLPLSRVLRLPNQIIFLDMFDVRPSVPSILNLRNNVVSGPWASIVRLFTTPRVAFFRSTRPFFRSHPAQHFRVSPFLTIVTAPVKFFPSHHCSYRVANFELLQSSFRPPLPTPLISSSSFLSVLRRPPTRPLNSPQSINPFFPLRNI